MTKYSKQRSNATLTRDELARLRGIVDAKKGLSGAALALDLPRSTLQAALAGMGLREGTVMVVRARLALAAAEEIR